MVRKLILTLTCVLCVASGLLISYVINEHKEGACILLLVPLLIYMCGRKAAFYFSKRRSL